MTTESSLPTPAESLGPEVLEALMCRAGLAVAFLDGSGRLAMVSPALQQLLNLPFDCVPADALAEHFQLYADGGARLLQSHEVPLVRAWSGEVVDGAIVTIKPPGQPRRHLSVHAAPATGPDGERHGAWAVMVDVSSRVASARGELSRSMAETVNHDLRTPLTSLLGHTELLLDRRDDLPPDVVRSIAALDRASRRLAEVVACISDWIDVAFGSEAAGNRADLGLLARAAARSR